MGKRKTREEYLGKLKQDYERTHIKARCEEIIRTVMPRLERIEWEMAEKYRRQVVQYMTSRVKSAESIFNKLIRKRRSRTLQKAVDTFHDIAGIRVVCTFQDDVYHVVKAIKNLPDLEVVQVKDYIAHPKPTGYRSIHIITRIPSCHEKMCLEIQVSSAAMNYWAMLDHQLSYKNSRVESEKIEKMEEELKSYAFEIADIDKKFLKIRKMIEKL